MVNNPPVQQGLHEQRQQLPASTALVTQQADFQVKQLNQQHRQSPVPQASPLMAQKFPFYPQVPLPYYPQYPAPPSNNPSTSSEATLVEILQKQIDRQDRLEQLDEKRA